MKKHKFRFTDTVISSKGCDKVEGGNFFSREKKSFTLIELLVNTAISSLCFFKRGDKLEQQNTPLFLKEKGGAGERGNFFSREKKFPLSPAHSHFTLIELLVVIAIIAILAAILLPSLQSARARAVTTNCVSMRKQVGMWLQFYTDTFDGWLVPADWGGKGKNERWYSALYKANITKWNRLDQYFGCPARPGTAGTPTDGASITYNRRLGDMVNGMYRISSCLIPAKKFAVADSRSGYVFDEERRVSSLFDPTKPSKEGFAPNHNRKTGTMLFLDNHAEAMELVNRDLPTAAGYWFPKRNDL